MADIRPAPPPMPMPPPGAPSSGSNAGKAVSAPNALAATKGSGGTGSGGKGGGGRGSSMNESSVDQTETDSLGMDRSSMSGAGLGTMTLQAAISHFRKSTVVMAPSAADLTALKKALKEHGLGQNGNTGIEQFGAAEAAIEHLGDIDRDVSGGFDSDFELREQLGFEKIGLDDNYAPLFDDVDINDDGMFIVADRASLQPARKGRFVRLTPELSPQSPAQHAHILSLVRDPRAGLAPEGLAALDAEKAQGVSFVRVTNGRGDFFEATDDASEPNILWSLVPLRQSDDTFADLTRAAKDADSGKMHLIVDANGIPPTPSLARAIRTTSTAFPKVRVHLSMNAQSL